MVREGQRRAIWDVDGVDTLDASAYADPKLRVVLNLNDGGFSSIGRFTDNVSIAVGTQIENAKGGAGDDLLIGNTLANELDGGAGYDTLQGGAGFDSYRFNGRFGGDTILDSDGLGELKFDGATLSGIERLKGFDSIWTDATRLYQFVWQPDATGRGDPVIGKRTSATDSKFVGFVFVKNFANGDLGLNLSSTERPTVVGGTTGPINVYLSNPLGTTPGSMQFINPAVFPDVQTTGAQPYTDLNPVAHWVWAKMDGGQVITLGNGDDFVDVARPERNPLTVQVWTPGLGQNQDVVVTGGSNDTILAGSGSDFISAGAGDDLGQSTVTTEIVANPIYKSGARSRFDLKNATCRHLKRQNPVRCRAQWPNNTIGSMT